MAKKIVDQRLSKTTVEHRLETDSEYTIRLERLMDELVATLRQIQDSD